MRIRSNCFLLILLLITTTLFGQDFPEEEQRVFSFTEYLAIVKEYHPVVAQANLRISEAEAQLLKARGAYDPEVSGGLYEKNFNGTEYYQLWDGMLKVPTWYGVDLKAEYQQNTGEYLNPQNTVPEDGLWSAGVSIKVLEGLIYNNRMNTLRKAKILTDQNEMERNVEVNRILGEAARAYAEWMLYYQNKNVYDEFLENAQIRFNGIVTSSLIGETPIIDTVETKITVEQRLLELQGSQLNLQKARLNLSSFLWIDDVPVQLNDNLIPNMQPEDVLETLGVYQVLGNAQFLENHPELLALGYELDRYDLDVKLRRNDLLPDVDVSYNFLNESVDNNNAWNTQNYKASVSVKLPLFLRSERGELRLAQIKRENTELKLADKQWKLTNKILASEQEVLSYQDQVITAESVVNNNEIMVRGEQRLFELGESSIFLLNTRENKLIDARIKWNDIKYKYNKAVIKLFESLRINWD